MTADNPFPSYDLPPIRNEIAANVRQLGWEVDGRGVMRYVGIKGGTGNLDKDYAEALVDDHVMTEVEAGLRPRGARPATVDLDAVRRLHLDDGLTLTATAEALGVGIQAMRRAMRLGGVEARVRRPKPCGTVAAAKRHRSRGEAPCDECRKAERERAAKRLSKVPATTREECGTDRGYHKHHAAGEVTCQSCRKAHATAVYERNAGRFERWANEQVAV